MNPVRSNIRVELIPGFNGEYTNTLRASLQAHADATMTLNVTPAVRDAEAERLVASIVECFYGDIRRELYEVARAARFAMLTNNPMNMQAAIEIGAKFDKLIERMEQKAARHC